MAEVLRGGVGLFPARRDKFRELLLGRARQAREHVLEVAPRINAAPSAANDYRVDHRAAPTGLGMANKQIVFLAYRTGSDRVFGQVVVNFQATVLQIGLQRLPFPQGILDGFTQRTLRQKRGANLVQATFDVAPDRRRQFLTQEVTLLGRQRFGARVGFDPIEFANLVHKPLCLGWFIDQRVDKFAPHMSQTGAGFETALWGLAQRTVNPITVPLQITAKIAQQLPGIFGTSTRMKLENHIPARAARHPQVTFDALAFDLRIQDPHRGLVDLQIIARQQLVLHAADDRLEPFGTSLDPITQGAACQRDPQSFELLLLPVQRYMVVILGQHDLAYQTWAWFAFLNDRGRQLGNSDRALTAATSQLGPNNFLTNEFGRNILQPFAALAANLAFWLTAVRTNFFFGLKAFGHDFQHLGPGMTVLASGWTGWLSLALWQDHVLGSRGFTPVGEDFQELLFLRVGLGNWSFIRAGAVKLLFELLHLPTQLLVLQLQAGDGGLSLRKAAGRGRGGRVGHRVLILYI